MGTVSAGFIGQAGSNLAAQARIALEQVRVGNEQVTIEQHYSSEFIDHVNDLTFYGLDGARRSVKLYKRILQDFRIQVEEQIVARNRVVSRFIVTGTNRGRPVRFNGITISRFQDGLIIEDWAVTDTLSMLRQLGLWRSGWLILSQWKRLAALRAR